MSDMFLSFFFFPSLQKLHCEALFRQQQVSHVQHCGSPVPTALQHQVSLMALSAF